MRDLEHPWDSPTMDREVREALAQSSVEEMLELTGTAGWLLLVLCLDASIEDLLNDLARSSKDDEQNRGAIRALRHVRRLPENLIRAAAVELDKHRGT
jgi:hypothetical protein